MDKERISVYYNKDTEAMEIDLMVASRKNLILMLVALFKALIKHDDMAVGLISMSLETAKSSTEDY